MKFYFVPVLLLIGLILVSGCVRSEQEDKQKEYKNAEGSEIIKDTHSTKKVERIGDLCQGEENCKQFCLNNHGICESFCRDDPTLFCEKLSIKPLLDTIPELCKTREECWTYCSENSFTCEAYCVKHPGNEFCVESYSYLYNESDQGFKQSYMRFPEFRNYNYTFKNGKLEEKTPKVEHLGVEIDFYDKAANKAGDFVFGKFTYPWGGVYNNKVFHDYGSGDSKNGTVDRNPQVVYILPLGTKVRAISSGIVTGISKVYSGDYTVGVTNVESPTWGYEHEHVINVVVKEGDFVVAGQVLAEVSNYSQWLRNNGYGVVDIGLFRPRRDSPGHHCPFLYLNESVKQDYFEKIIALYKSWEKYEGNSTIYDEDNYSTPGCLVEEPLD